jgi:hypothetical protein
MPFGTTTIIFPDDHAVIRKLDSSPRVSDNHAEYRADRHPRTPARWRYRTTTGAVRYLAWGDRWQAEWSTSAKSERLKVDATTTPNADCADLVIVPTWVPICPCRMGG